MSLVARDSLFTRSRNDETVVGNEVAEHSEEFRYKRVCSLVPVTVKGIAKRPYTRRGNAKHFRTPGEDAKRPHTNTRIAS